MLDGDDAVAAIQRLQQRVGRADEAVRLVADGLVETHDRPGRAAPDGFDHTVTLAWRRLCAATDHLRSGSRLIDGYLAVVAGAPPGAGPDGLLRVGGTVAGQARAAAALICRGRRGDGDGAPSRWEALCDW